MPHVGAQLRYLKELTHGILGAVGIAAPALALADRDEWIDWAPGVCRKRLHRTLGLSRILIRPSVRCRCLASQMLNQSCAACRDKVWQYCYSRCLRARWKSKLETVPQIASESLPDRSARGHRGVYCLANRLWPPTPARQQKALTSRDAPARLDLGGRERTNQEGSTRRSEGARRSGHGPYGRYRNDRREWPAHEASCAQRYNP